MGRRSKKNNKKLLILIIFILIVAVGYLASNTNYNTDNNNSNNVLNSNLVSFNIENIPEYKGNPYVIINNNIPSFSQEDYTTNAFETYSELDSLGRCGIAYANICKEIMPKEDEERQSISSIKPSGWQTAVYEEIVEGDYLYNRCHLIGHQLAGENANEKNLITGTRYMNVDGMLPFENQIADYIEENENNHVLYRVTPFFEGNNLIANGVQMEAYSVEDNGEGVCFNVYVYNVQPQIIIDYATGESRVAQNSELREYGK